jgi:ABC-2 type transport system permease protein
VKAALLLLGKDVRLLGRTPALLFALVAYPIVIALVVGVVVRYTGERPRVALVDPNGALSGLVVVGDTRFDVASRLEHAAEVDLVRMSPAQARHELETGQVTAVLEVPPDFISKLRGLRESPTLTLRSTRGGLGTRVVEKMRSLVYSTNLELQQAYIDANLAAVRLLLHGGSGSIGRTGFSLLGVQRAREELRALEKSRDLPTATRARQLDRFMGQLQGAVGQVGSFLRATANPIELRQVEGGGRTWLLSAQVQGYALALAVAFVTVLLGAGALVAEREENVLARLARGLCTLGQLVVEKVAYVGLVGAAMGAALALAFGVVVEAGGVSGGEPWQRLPLLLCGLVVAAAAFGAFGVLVGALARESATATIVAFLVALPLMLLALVPPGASNVARWLAALFPFGHAQSALSAALYDASPAGTLLRQCAWLVALCLVYGAAARVAARRMLG